MTENCKEKVGDEKAQEDNQCINAKKKNLNHDFVRFGVLVFQVLKQLIFCTVLNKSREISRVHMTFKKS